MAERRTKRCKCGRRIYTAYNIAEGICEYCHNKKVKSYIKTEYMSNIEPKIENKTYPEYMSIKLIINLDVVKNDKESLFYEKE